MSILSNLKSVFRKKELHKHSWEKFGGPFRTGDGFSQKWICTGCRKVVYYDPRY